MGRAALWSAASLAIRRLEAQSPKSRIDRSRISAISDEIAMSPEESIAFAHHFGLQWLELRDVPGLPGQQNRTSFCLKMNYGHRPSCFATAALKFPLSIRIC